MTIAIVNQVLCKHEHAVGPLAELMELFVKEHEYPHVVSDILREIGKLQPRNLAKDAVAAKNIGNFINEVAARLPRVVLPATSALLSLLDGEVKLFRIASLVCFDHGVVISAPQRCRPSPRPARREGLLQGGRKRRTHT